jgi:hypothetical protein
MGTRSRMSRHIDESVETRYHEIKRCSTENYLLSHEKWGELIANKFAHMPKPGQASLLLETNKHAMAMFLSAKHQRSTAGFEPNGVLSPLFRPE